MVKNRGFMVFSNKPSNKPSTIYAEGGKYYGKNAGKIYILGRMAGMKEDM